MVRSVLVLSVVMASVGVLADEANMKLLQGTQVVGSGKLFHQVKKNGESEFQVLMTIQSSAGPYVLKQIDRYDAKARPIESNTTDESAGIRTTRTYQFQKDYLLATVTANGKTTSNKVPYPKGKSIIRTSQRWFFSEMPLPGSVSREVVYQGDKWVDRISRYIGLKDIQIGDKKVKAYELVDRKADGTDEVRQWVDRKGMPLRMEFTSGGAKLTLERESL